MAYSLRHKIGCWLNERPAMERALRASSGSCAWLDLGNRHETVSRCEDGLGRICDWKDSSYLTACRIFPHLGGRLLETVARDHSFSFLPQAGSSPLSVILPVRGRDREEALSFVVSALLALAGTESEVLICEHDEAPLLEKQWPEGVRHVFIPASEGEAFNKSKALNAGALAARHSLLLLHDADVWPCVDYISACQSLMEHDEWEAIRPIRFLFLLDQEQSQICFQSQQTGKGWAIPKVQQNNPGLSSFVRRDTYMDLGGHDEGFTGWGWEDMEFLSRLQTRKLYPGSFLPAIHLWHDIPPAKQRGELNVAHLQQVLNIPVKQRIEQARRQLEQGSAS